MMRGLGEFLTRPCRTAVGRGERLLLVIGAGLLGGLFEAVLGFARLPSPLWSGQACARYLSVHVWLAGWFAVALALSLSLSRRLWARLLLSLVFSPAIFILARFLTPDFLPFHAATREFHCTKGMTLESWSEFIVDQELRWLAAASCGVSLFTLAEHASLRLHPRWIRVRGVYWIFAAAGLAAGVFLYASSELAFLIDLPEDAPSADERYVLGPSGLSGGAYALSQFIGFAFACGLEKARRQRAADQPERRCYGLREYQDQGVR